MKLIFHPEADAEMLESARYYEERSRGLGMDFLTAVQATTDQILKHPRVGRVERANIRRSLVRGFPFAVLYELHDDQILIAAVMHQNRRPGYWLARLAT